MIAAIKTNFQDKKLLFAFLVLILLTAVIGIIGISQVNKLSRRVEVIGRVNLKLENAVLEMRVNNTVYAMGIRNYAYWKVSRYLGSAPLAVNFNDILKAASRFREELKIYKDYANTRQQLEWAKQTGSSFDELVVLGKQILDLADSPQNENEGSRINNLLVSFENRLSKIDEFLGSTMSKANLEEVQEQMSLAHTDKEQAIFFLKLCIIVALVMGTLIALAVYRRRIEERNYRQQLFNRMINMEESERKNLSAAVHDEMGQDLSALKIYLGVIEQGLTVQQQELKSKIIETKKIIADLIGKSHNIALLLRPPDLDEVGLIESVEALLIDFKHLTGVNYIYRKPEDGITLTPERSLLIYRIAQELLTNMAKHAKAKNLEIGLEKNEARVKFFYCDDGLGFDSKIALKSPHRRKVDQLGLGLLGLKERVELLDGEMNIDSSYGKGTLVRVTLPV